MSSYSHQYFSKEYIMPFNITINFWKRTSCLIFTPFFWNWYSMSKFCFIFPPVFLKKVHHAKLIRIGFLRLRTPCLLFAPCFFKREHGVLYSHHLKGISTAVLLFAPVLVLSSREYLCSDSGVFTPSTKKITVTFLPPAHPYPNNRVRRRLTPTPSTYSWRNLAYNGWQSKKTLTPCKYGEFSVS